MPLRVHSPRYFCDGCYGSPTPAWCQPCLSFSIIQHPCCILQADSAIPVTRLLSQESDGIGEWTTPPRQRRGGHASHPPATLQHPCCKISSLIAEDWLLLGTSPSTQEDNYKASFIAKAWHSNSAVARDIRVHSRT